jgi:hypothetical protein
MAAQEQPRAGGPGFSFATANAHDQENSALTSGTAMVPAQKPRLAGSIATGIVIGAVVAFLVGGLVGIHETGSGTVHVSTASISQPAAH